MPSQLMLFINTEALKKLRIVERTPEPETKLKEENSTEMAQALDFNNLTVEQKTQLQQMFQAVMVRTIDQFSMLQN